MNEKQFNEAPRTLPIRDPVEVRQEVENPKPTFLEKSRLAATSMFTEKAPQKPSVKSVETLREVTENLRKDDYQQNLPLEKNITTTTTTTVEETVVDPQSKDIYADI
jgi:hypothetical protein